MYSTFSSRSDLVCFHCPSSHFFKFTPTFPSQRTFYTFRFFSFYCKIASIFTNLKGAQSSPKTPVYLQLCTPTVISSLDEFIVKLFAKHWQVMKPSICPSHFDKQTGRFCLGPPLPKTIMLTYLTHRRYYSNSLK